jgi:hypothetical protein
LLLAGKTQSSPPACDKAHFKMVSSLMAAMMLLMVSAGCVSGAGLPKVAFGE